ncbi:MAG: carboxypeptidase M32 [Gemmatimonas sp.]|nr:carboxypeptidase M32 [Gemmatimonas sp.]
MSERESKPRGPYDELRAELRETDLFASIGAVLSWDQETMLPDRGTGLRAEQLALLSQVVHERRTSERFGALLAESEADESLRDDELARANLREIRRSYDQAIKLPSSLVREIAETTTLSIHAWRGAREKSDFSAFAPWLEKVVGLDRAKAECLATEDAPDLYDALLDQYEPGADTAELVAVFTDLRKRLAPLIHDVTGAARQRSDRVHRIEVPIEAQKAFNAKVAARVGFDFEAGRLDTSTHPFCQGVGPGDTRLTTRYREDGFFDALSSTLHETGHGLYEQGLPKDRYLGEPLGDPVSLGIHESQSRLWENLVGRSREFWKWALPEAQREFSPALDDVALEEVYGAMNLVQPNLIRVDSDEATYNLHIMLRFDLERAMLSGDLAVADLPAAWNDRIKTDLGLDVPDDRRGCLQDVHWSMGSIGYFPTYTLGNLYAAQLWLRIQSDLPDLPDSIAAGDFTPLLAWLRREIHVHGRRYTAPELCERATGAPLSADAFMNSLEGKLRPLYAA